MKAIQFGIPHTSIESTFLATCLFRNSPTSTVQVRDTWYGRNIGSIFEGMARVAYVDQPIPEDIAMKMYGNPAKRDFSDHVAKMYVNSFEMGHDNYIPWMTFTPSDIERARDIVSRFKGPICISPICGQYHRDRDWRKHVRMMDLSVWHKMVSQFKRAGRDVFYFTSSKNYVEIPGTIPFLDIPLRDMCALFRVSGHYAGIENGMLYGAIASGARCLCIIPEHNNTHFVAKNWVFTDDMWKHEAKRVFYITMSEMVAKADQPLPI